MQSGKERVLRAIVIPWLAHTRKFSLLLDSISLAMEAVEATERRLDVSSSTTSPVPGMMDEGWLLGLWHGEQEKGTNYRSLKESWFLLGDSIHANKMSEDVCHEDCGGTGVKTGKALLYNQPCIRVMHQGWCLAIGTLRRTPSNERHLFRIL